MRELFKDYQITLSTNSFASSIAINDGHCILPGAYYKPTTFIVLWYWSEWCLSIVTMSIHKWKSILSFGHSYKTFLNSGNLFIFHSQWVWRYGWFYNHTTKGEIELFCDIFQISDLLESLSKQMSRHVKRFVVDRYKNIIQCTNRFNEKCDHR